MDKNVLNILIIKFIIKFVFNYRIDVSYFYVFESFFCFLFIEWLCVVYCVSINNVLLVENEIK